jgi:hypothetical protein
LRLSEGLPCPAGDGFSSETPGSEPGAGASPAKAPLQAVSEKNISPKNTRRIVGLSQNCIRSFDSRDFGQKYGIRGKGST